MSIETILARHQSLMEEASKAIEFGAVKAEALLRPLEQQERRLEALKRRLDRIEQDRGEYNKRVDGLVAALKDELSVAEARLEADRKTLAPVRDGKPRPKRPTG